jgi:urea transport system ATP-binding protein
MTPDLMRAGADVRRHAEERAAAPQTGSSGGRVASYSRIVTPGQLDIAHGCAASSARTEPARRR